MSDKSFKELANKGLEEHLGIKQVTIHWYELLGLAVVSIALSALFNFVVIPPIQWAFIVLCSVISFGTLYVFYSLAKEAVVNNEFTWFFLKLLFVVFIIVLFVAVLAGFTEDTLVALIVVGGIIALVLWRLTLFIAIIVGLIAFAISSPLYFLLTIIAIALVIIAINTSVR